jgi:hypothetical protein
MIARQFHLRVINTLVIVMFFHKRVNKTKLAIYPRVAA